MSEFAMLGWIGFAVMALGWWLSSRYDSHEREIVTVLNQLGARLTQIEQAKGDRAELNQLGARLAQVETAHPQKSNAG